MTEIDRKELNLTFDAVYYHITDMNKAIAFYRDTLGFRLISRDYVARFSVDGVLFELVPDTPGSNSSGTGNARLSLGVQDIKETTLALQAKGIATTPIKIEQGGLIAFFTDPDGNELCLWQSDTSRPTRQLRTVCDSAGVPMIEVVKSEDGTITLFEADDMDNKIQFSASLISQLVRQLQTVA